MQSTYPSIKEPFPQLPPKNYITAKDDAIFIKERKLKLHIFLDELLKTMHIERILDDTCLSDFLEFYNFTSGCAEMKSVASNLNSSSSSSS